MFNIEHITISVKNLEETIKFYNIFGLKLIKKYEDDKVQIARLSLNGMVLEVFCYKGYNELPTHSKSLNTDLKTIGNKHFGLGVKNIYEAKEFIERNMSNQSIQIKNGRLGKPYFFIKDPDGILLEIIEC